MQGIALFLAGVCVGVWSAAQSRALHLPVFHLPAHIHIEALPLLVIVAILLYAGLAAIRGKRTGGRS